MTYMKSSHITSKLLDEAYGTGETTGESFVFEDSQFFPAKDGTWLMVDYVVTFNHTYWYVTEGV